MATLITGASGFVGLALAEHLLARGEHVMGYDLMPPPPRALKAFAALPGRFDVVKGDVRDAALLTDAVLALGADRVVALAAITADAKRERMAPQSIFDVNVGGALAAVSAAAACGVQRVLLGSSGAVYGASGALPGPLDEVLTPLRPEGLYGMSKQTAESAATRLAGLHGIELAIGRLGTCFGPWEAATAVRDTLSAPLQVLALAQEGRTVLLPRAGLRDWLYVRDAAAALAALLDAPSLNAPNATYNLAAGFEWSVAQWCAQVAAERPGFDWRMARADETPNVAYYAPYDRASMAIDRLRTDTAFAPRFDLVSAASDYLAWDAAGCE